MNIDKADSHSGGHDESGGSGKPSPYNPCGPVSPCCLLDA